MKDWLALGLALVVGVSNGAAEPAPALVTAGRQWVEKNKCRVCHTVDGQGGKLGKPLNGAATGKSDEYLGKVLRDPKSVLPRQSRMPAFTISDEELTAVIAYLRSLKD